MNNTAKKITIFSLLLSAIGLQAAAPYFSIRSQSVNAARELVGWQQQIHLSDKEDCYSSLTITPEYTHSFRNSAIAHCLFTPHIDCSCKCPTIKISGKDVAGRGDCE